MSTVSRNRPLARTLLVALAAFLFLAPAQQQARAGEAYYLVMFGSQRTPNNPNYSHSFAAFVRVAWPGDGPCARPTVLETHTISWLPQSLVIRTLALCPECGGNFELHATLRYVLGSDERVSMWGPYQIEADLYCRALRRIAVLESGRVLYKANDMGHRDDRVTNCIHAISAIAEGPRLVVLSPGWGEMASWYILRELLPWVVDQRPDYRVSAALGLNAYPLIYRDLESPRSGTIQGKWRRCLGGEADLRATYGPPCPP